MSTPLTMVPSDAKKRRAKGKLNEREEVSSLPQLNTPDQAHSSKEADTAKVKRIKLSAVGKKYYAHPHGFLTGPTS